MIYNSRRHGAILFCLVLCFFLRNGGAASAHGILIRAEPADGAVVAEAPAAIQLWFNEAIVNRFSSVQLLNAQNQPVAEVSVQVDSQQADLLHITLPTIAPGGYTLFWKVLSDVDGHFSQGFTTLTIGQGTVAQLPAGAMATGGPSLLEAGLRWLNFILLTSLIGALVMVQFVLTPFSRQLSATAAAAQQHLHRQILRWAAACSGGAFLIGLALLAQQVAATQTVLAATTPWSEQIRLLLTQTQWGNLWVVRQGLLLFLGGGLWSISRTTQEPTHTWRWLLVAGRAIDLAIVQALAGHAIGSSPFWPVALGSATLHLLAAGAWMGMLFTLVRCFHLASKRNRQIIAGWQPINWRAFSLVAALSVLLLFVTGLLRMGQQVASLDALLTTFYGRLLIGKVSVVVCAGLCGLGNLLLVHPRIANLVGQWLGQRAARLLPQRRHLPHLIMLEGALGIAILATAGLLTATPPPRGVEYTIAPEDIKPVVGQRIDERIVTLEVKPNRPGQNLFNIRSVGAAPANSAAIMRVLLTFTYVGEGEAPATAIAEEVEPNRYQATGAYLSQAGPWQIDVITQRYGMADSVAGFRWVVPPMGPLQPVVLSKAPLAELLPVVAGVLALVGGVAVGLTGLYLRKQRHRPAQSRSPLHNLATLARSGNRD